MKLKFFLLAIVTSGIIASCVKHEVIPPPKPQVDLSSSFSADTSGTTISYVKDVDGFYIEATNFRAIQSARSDLRCSCCSRFGLYRRL